MVRSKKMLAFLPALMLLICAVALSACGSSGGSSSSSGSTEAATTAGAAEGNAEEGTTEEVSAEDGAGAAMTTEYAPGVPTLAELYEGEEETAPTKGPPVAKNVSVVWVSCGQEAPGCAQPAKTAEEAAKTLGWTFHVTDAKLGISDGNNRAVREAIALHPDVIVMYGTGCAEAQQPLKEAKEAGITVFGSGALDCDDKYSGGESVFDLEMNFNKTVPDNETFFDKWGENQAAYVIDASEGKAKIIEVNATASFGPHVKSGWDKVLDKCSECEVVDEVPYTGEEQAPNGPLYQKFQTALVQHPEATVVLTTWNTPYTISGLSKAIVDAGRTDLIVVGAEGDGPSNQLIEEEQGLSAAAAAYSSTRLSWATMDEINRFMNHQPLVPEGIGQIALAKGHNLPADGAWWEGKTPFEPEYEELWNVK